MNSTIAGATAGPDGLPDEAPSFASFIMAGFECSTPIDRDAGAVDLLAATRHDAECAADYDLMLRAGIRTAREGLSWRLIDQGDGVYDFSRYEPMMEIGRHKGVQQIWDLDHYGIPVHPFDETFVARFAAYARRAITVIRKYQSGTLIIVPINEITYFALMGAEWGQWYPFERWRAYDMKKQLVRASIAAMDAIWAIDPDVRFLQVDPIFRRVPKPPITVDKQDQARGFIEGKFESFDMLCGRRDPELGGAPRYLDLLGANYYWYNQEWILRDEAGDGPLYRTIPWRSPHRVSVAAMLAELLERYRRPVVLTETGAEGKLRGRWWKRVLREADEALAMGVPLHGVCCYPIIDSPDWTSGKLLGQGFWDLDRRPHGSLRTGSRYRPAVRP